MSSDLMSPAEGVFLRFVMSQEGRDIAKCFADKDIYVVVARFTDQNGLEWTYGYGGYGAECRATDPDSGPCRHHMKTYEFVDRLAQDLPGDYVGQALTAIRERHLDIKHAEIRPTPREMVWYIVLLSSALALVIVAVHFLGKPQ